LVDSRLPHLGEARPIGRPPAAGRSGGCRDLVEVLEDRVLIVDLEHRRSDALVTRTEIVEVGTVASPRPSRPPGPGPPLGPSPPLGSHPPFGSRPPLGVALHIRVQARHAVLTPAANLLLDSSLTAQVPQIQHCDRGGRTARPPESRTEVNDATAVAIIIAAMTMSTRLRKRYLRALTSAAVVDSSRRCRLPRRGAIAGSGAASASKPEVSSMYSYSPPVVS